MAVLTSIDPTVALGDTNDFNLVLASDIDTPLIRAGERTQTGEELEINGGMYEAI